jgi:hypothetical protein
MLTEKIMYLREHIDDPELPEEVAIEMLAAFDNDEKAIKALFQKAVAMAEKAMDDDFNKRFVEKYPQPVIQDIKNMTASEAEALRAYDQAFGKEIDLSSQVFLDVLDREFHQVVKDRVDIAFSASRAVH